MWIPLYSFFTGVSKFTKTGRLHSLLDCAQLKTMCVCLLVRPQVGKLTERVECRCGSCLPSRQTSTLLRNIGLGSAGACGPWTWQIRVPSALLLERRPTRRGCFFLVRAKKSKEVARNIMTNLKKAWASPFASSVPPCEPMLSQHFCHVLVALPPLARAYAWHGWAQA